MSDPDEDVSPAAHRRKRGFLLRNALSLVSTAAVTSGMGFIYWTVAARTFSASDVGESATAIAAMSLIAPFAVLGLGTALVFKLPNMRSGRAELVSTAAAVCAVVAVVVSLSVSIGADTCPSSPRSEMHGIGAGVNSVCAAAENQATHHAPGGDRGDKRCLAISARLRFGQFVQYNASIVWQKGAR